MDDAGRGRRQGAVDGGRGAGLVGIGGEEGDQAEKRITGVNQPGQGGLLEPQRDEIFLSFRRILEPGDLGLDLGGDDDGPGAFRLGLRHDAFGGGVAAGRRLFLDVADVKHRLRGQELKLAHQPGVGVTHLEVPGRAALA